MFHAYEYSIIIILLLVIQDDKDTDNTVKARTVKVFVADKPGAVWEVLNEFGVC